MSKLSKRMVRQGGVIRFMRNTWQSRAAELYVGCRVHCELVKDHVRLETIPPKYATAHYIGRAHLVTK